jgi:hypothetical protein
MSVRCLFFIRIQMSIHRAKICNLKVYCHEIVCKLRPLVHSLGPNNTPRISFKLVKLRIKNIRRFKQGPLDVKWWGLDSTVLLKSALKFITLYWHIAVFSRRIATERIAVPRIAIVRGPNLRAECQRPDSSAVFNGTAAVRSKGVINH